MDWRCRKYYKIIYFDGYYTNDEIDDLIYCLKNIKTVKMRPYSGVLSQPDEDHPRGKYLMIVGVHVDYAEEVESIIRSSPLCKEEPVSWYEVKRSDNPKGVQVKRSDRGFAVGDIVMYNGVMNGMIRQFGTVCDVFWEGSIPVKVLFDCDQSKAVSIADSALDLVDKFDQKINFRFNDEDIIKMLS